VRRLFITDDARTSGLTTDALRWGETKGRWRRIMRGVYGEGPEDPSPLDLARARVLSCGGVAGGRLGAVLYGLDSVALARTHRRRRTPPAAAATIGGIPCASGLDVLVDLAAALTDDAWEQALESVLRKRLATVAELNAALPALRASRAPGVARIRRVLARRPPGTPPTESLLETRMVQLARTVDGLPEPVRQHEVVDAHGAFVARVDLCWPALGLFVELDGQQHKEQPVYDARRETAVVAATGWLVARFTWHEVVQVPRTTARRLAIIAGHARRAAD
jgi:hypothetical protein